MKKDKRIVWVLNLSKSRFVKLSKNDLVQEISVSSTDADGKVLVKVANHYVRLPEEKRKTSLWTQKPKHVEYDEAVIDKGLREVLINDSHFSLVIYLPQEGRESMHDEMRNTKFALGINMATELLYERIKLDQIKSLVDEVRHESESLIHNEDTLNRLSAVKAEKIRNFAADVGLITKKDDDEETER